MDAGENGHPGGLGAGEPGTKAGGRDSVRWTWTERDIAARDVRRQRRGGGAELGTAGGGDQARSGAKVGAWTRYVGLGWREMVVGNSGTVGGGVRGRDAGSGVGP